MVNPCSAEEAAATQPATHPPATQPATQPTDKCFGVAETLAPGEAPEGMVWVPGGTFVMGHDGAFARPDERPPHAVHVDGFWMDATEVTNAQFRAFVQDTGYVTVAERPVDWEELKQHVPPGTPKPTDEMLQPSSVVFAPPAGAARIDLRDWRQWWRLENGADWRRPLGPGSDIEGRDDHPVVHVAYEDAGAYAAWAGKRLPTEAEWEFAARGGLHRQTYVWGEEFQPGGEFLSNTFQGVFPHGGQPKDGFSYTAPVKTYPPNGFGLYDMAGNVWEWTTDWFRRDTYAKRAPQGLASHVVENPSGPDASFDPNEPSTPKRVTRGGSFLCHDSYCASYRPAARMASAPDTSLIHTGFRCVRDPE